MSFNFKIAEVSITASASSLVTDMQSFSVNDVLFTARKNTDEVSISLNKTNIAISEVSAAIANTDDVAVKEALIAQRETLINKKSQLELKQKELKQKIDIASNEIKSYESRMLILKSEIGTLNSKKMKYESELQQDNTELDTKNVYLKDIKEQVATAQAELEAEITEIQKMTAQAQKESNAKLLSQRKSISSLTAEATERVQSGSMEPDEVAGFISAQLGDMASQDDSQISIVDAKNSKIRALYANLGNLISIQITTQAYIDALSSKISESSDVISGINTTISAKENELKNTQNIYDVKVLEKSALDMQYSDNAVEISGIDTQITSLSKQISTYELPEEQKSNMSLSASSNKKVSADDLRNTSAIIQEELTAVDFSYIDEAFSHIQENYAKKISAQTAESTQLSNVQSKISEADDFVNTLRNKLADNAQKLIEERLSIYRRS